jgi:hypothetical protein
MLLVVTTQKVVRAFLVRAGLRRHSPALATALADIHGNLKALRSVPSRGDCAPLAFPITNRLSMVSCMDTQGASQPHAAVSISGRTKAEARFDLAQTLLGRLEWDSAIDAYEAALAAGYSRGLARR